MLGMRTSVLEFLAIKVRGILLLSVILALAGGLRADVVENRKAFALQLTKDISRLGLREVYIPDFTDSSGKQLILGRFFAGTFSQLLSENAKGFAVTNRVEVHRYLKKKGWTDHDLSSPDARAKLAAEFAPDAILWGTFSANQDVATIDLVARDPNDKELFHARYEEKINPGLRDDLEARQSDGDYYFPGLDGVTLPECLSCPEPYYPVGQGSPRMEGQVLLSVLITPEGKPDQIHVLEKLEPSFDRAAIEAVRSWRFGPAKDADGKFVLVRVPVEVTFKRSWRLH